MDQVHPLRTWRREAKKTLDDLADAVSVTPSHLSEIERWENTPSLALADKLSKHTGIPMDRFVKQNEAAQ